MIIAIFITCIYMYYFNLVVLEVFNIETRRDFLISLIPFGACINSIYKKYKSLRNKVESSLTLQP